METPTTTTTTTTSILTTSIQNLYTTLVYNLNMAADSNAHAQGSPPYPDSSEFVSLEIQEMKLDLLRLMESNERNREATAQKIDPYFFSEDVDPAFASEMRKRAKRTERFAAHLVCADLFDKKTAPGRVSVDLFHLLVCDKLWRTGAGRPGGEFDLVSAGRPGVYIGRGGRTARLTGLGGIGMEQGSTGTAKQESPYAKLIYELHVPRNPLPASEYQFYYDGHKGPEEEEEEQERGYVMV